MFGDPPSRGIIGHLGNKCYGEVPTYTVLAPTVLALTILAASILAQYILAYNLYCPLYILTYNPYRLQFILVHNTYCLLAYWYTISTTIIHTTR